MMFLILSLSIHLNLVSATRIPNGVNNYYGEWSSKHPFLDYTEKKGFFKVKFPKSFNTTSISTIKITLKDGFYVDDKYQTFKINTAEYDRQFDEINFNPNNYTDINKSLYDSLYKGYLHFDTRFNIRGQFCIENICVLYHAHNKNESVYEKPRVIYSFFLFCICFIQSFIASKVHEFIRMHDNIAKDISLWSWILNASIDLSIITFNIQELIRNQDSVESMMMGLIWSILSFYTIRSKLLFIIFRAHRPSLTTASAQIIFSRQILIFYIVSFLANILAYQVIEVYSVLIVIMSSFHIPQIYLNAYNNITTLFTPFIIIPISASRIIVLYIFLASPSNPLHLRPTYTLFSICTINLCLQTIIIISQRFQARMFIPKCFLPRPYEYLKDVEMTNFKECSICLGSKTTEKVMVPPCGHAFHQECLKKWLDI
ncbi:hypothetical protein SteCoe_29417 [Stentor coeruleus]|uniref:RING-type E3 ubiquitin transferase n=1 Tax=Stentor coeruleus TaxID=5963 RepID=A0A1R2B681_9CILI|nr:hypothetical protein SteCoe_29417 [Stentor coeruleus]